ncbi:chitinase [Aspergillus campestris IBT 28561]|uniref:chitinase n=1 Tax=Aspergillus campestris (strain IBT 28561) TaxID=1392248 RepID=A0A2I1CRA3_ASPC2|nr:chitinase [Aspergillus campestris IBT 28561]PKY00152.1 chitinase [Aspergillus campestris IBT 28561]
MAKSHLVAIAYTIIFLLFQAVVGLEGSNLTFHLLAGDPDYGCTADKPCKVGCCGSVDKTTGKGVCGLGPDFCGKGCISNCDRKSECDPGWGTDWSDSAKCPLNVCCSKFGFCGTTADFCGSATVTSPECPGGSSAMAKTIGYYEAWNLERPCGTMTPMNIPLGYYTHINFAFALINPKTFHIAPMTEQTDTMYKSVTQLKTRQRDLKVWIAIGGWAMNDPGPTRTTFSDLAASIEHQDIFFESLVTFLVNNNFDGVDLDWEYPVADDRGGKPEDYKNMVTLMKRLRERLNQTGRHYGISITLPASYWYLRGFDLTNIEPHIDWFNVMTYDIHGLWDRNVTSIGSYALAHTNLTEINMGLELLWRNNVNPARVVMGLGFYGRSYTMADSGCMASGCPFKDPARPGRCTGQEGILAGYEINDIIKKGGKVTYDKEAAVKIVTWDNDQWVSWDDAESLKVKLDFANKRCLGGTMVWAVDLDDGTLIGSLGEAMGKKKQDVPDDLPSYPSQGDLGTSIDKPA